MQAPSNALPSYTNTYAKVHMFCTHTDTIKSVRTANKICSEFGPNNTQRTRDVDSDGFSRNTLFLRNSQTTVATEGHLNTSLPYVPHQKKTPTIPESISYWLTVEIWWNKPEVIYQAGARILLSSLCPKEPWISLSSLHDGYRDAISGV